VRADWVGFEIPDEFVVGYGIDFAQRNRNLPYIGKVRMKDARHLGKSLRSGAWGRVDWCTGCAIDRMSHHPTLRQRPCFSLQGVSP
jgi:hypothetical protein